MNLFKRIFPPAGSGLPMLCGLVLVASLLSPVFGVTKTATTGLWSGAIWTPAGTPTSADSVNIPNAVSVTVDGADVCAALHVASAGGIKYSGANSLTITRDLTQAAPGGSNTDSVNIGAGTLTVTNIKITSSSGQKVCKLVISTGTVNCNGSITFAGTAANSQVNFTGAGILNLKGNFGTGGAFTQSTSTVNCIGTTAQTLGGYTYYNLTINNAAGVSLAAAAGVTTLTIGNVTANSLFSDAGFQLTSTGTFTISNQSTFKLGAAAATTFPAFATRTINPGTWVEYVSSAAQTVSLTPSYQKLRISGASKNQLAAGTALIVADTLAVTSGGGLPQGTGAQTIACGTYIQSSTSATAFVGQTAAITVSGNFTASAGTFKSTSGTLTIGGSAIMTGATFTHNSGTVTYNGANSDSINTNAGSLNNLTINGTGTWKMAANLTAAGTFTLTAGTFNIGTARTLTLSTAGSTHSFTGGTLNFGTNSVLSTSSTNATTIGANVIVSSAATDTLRFNNVTTAVNFNPGASTVTYPKTYPTIQLANTGNVTQITNGLKSNGIFLITNTSATASTFSMGALNDTCTGILLASGLNASTGLTAGGAGTIQCSGDVIINSGTFTAPSGTTNTSFTVTGNFNQSGGTFTHNSGTVTFTGNNAGQTITAGSAFNNVIANQTGTSTLGNGAALTISGYYTNSTSATTFNIGTGNVSVSGVFTLTNGTFNLGAGHVLTLSSAAGTHAYTAGTLNFGTNSKMSVATTAGTDMSAAGLTVSAAATDTLEFTNASGTPTFTPKNTTNNPGVRRHDNTRCRHDLAGQAHRERGDFLNRRI